MKKHFLLLYIFYISQVFPQEHSLLSKMLFSTEILCGTVLLGATWYCDAGYIKNKCTQYKKEKIWKRSSQTVFTDGSTGKEILFSNEEIRKKIKLIFAAGYMNEEYEFYDNDLRRIEKTAPASPDLKDDDKIVEYLSEIRIIPQSQNFGERQTTVYKKAFKGGWIRRIIKEVSKTRKVTIQDKKKEQKLLSIRKFVQGIGCAFILLGATHRLYNSLSE